MCSVSLMVKFPLVKHPYQRTVGKLRRKESIHNSVFRPYVVWDSVQNFQFGQSHQKQHSLEIWAVKLRFLLVYENMLKSIATARTKCTTKQENKASYNTDYIPPDLIEFFGDD